jgi:hypothetical protein
MENNELYELYYKISLDIAKKQKGTKGAVCVDTTYETALEFAKQYKKLSEGNPANSDNANCAIFDVVRSLRFDKPTKTGWQFDPDLLRSITKSAMKHDPLISMEHVEYVLRAIADKQ